MREQDVRLCASWGANIIGFVVDYPHPVVWNLDTASAKALVASVVKPVQTCIVVGGSVDKIRHLAYEIQPDYVQLHDNESLDDTALLVKELHVGGIRVIKALFPDTSDLLETAMAFAATGIHSLLLDARTPNNASQSGTADLELYEQVCRVVDCPVILAGGITPANVAEIAIRSRPPIIDIMTGVESEPGVKDAQKVRTLFMELADAENVL